MASSIPGAGEAPQRGLGQRGAGHGSGVGRGTAAGTQSYLRPVRDEMRPAREVGTRRLRLTSALYWAPGTLTHAPRRRSRSAVSTTLSDSSHMKSGIPEVSIPARWWNSVCTNPGQRGVRQAQHRLAVHFEHLELVGHRDVQEGALVPEPRVVDQQVYPLTD